MKGVKKMFDHEIYMHWARNLREMIKVAGNTLLVLAVLAAIGGTCWGAMALLLLAVAASGAVTALDERLMCAAEEALWRDL